MENRTLLLGHRGARGVKTAAENTLAAFDLALAQGCAGFEFDVRLTADGQAVVCHDDSYRGNAIAQSPAQRLGLPLLGEVLSRYRSSAFLDIELKVAGLERITSGLLHEYAPERGFVVSSFLPGVLRTFHEIDAAAPLGLICETEVQLSQWSRMPVAYVIPHFKLLRQSLIREIQSSGRKTFVWTVNAPAAMKRLAGWGVDGIISDYPERLAITLGRIDSGE